MKCPRCQTGQLFTHKWYQLKHVVDMPKECSVCKQRTELELGFYTGTGYVSYALTVGISVISIFVWWKTIGLSAKDNRIFWWLGLNGLTLVLLQPWLMRISRAIWLSWFFHKDDKFHEKDSIK